MDKITRQTNIGALLKAHPDMALVMKKYKLDCIGCGGIHQETLEMGATAHGLDVDEIVDALNAALRK